jgi:pimeloyl-ACP methyl ester carboxylesterase
MSLTVSACGGSGSACPSTQSPSAGVSSVNASPEESVDKPELVDIGGGRQLSVPCIATGTGRPTMIFESGDESEQFQWSGVYRQLAMETRVCAYDWLGNGSSDPATGCRRYP